MAKWLRNCKVRTFKKIYGSRVDVDGVHYRIHSYSKLIDLHIQLAIGDPIFNTYLNCYDRIAEIRDRWHKIDGLRNGYWREIYFITRTNYIIYDYHDNVYAPPTAWDDFLAKELNVQ